MGLQHLLPTRHQPAELALPPRQLQHGDMQHGGVGLSAPVRGHHLQPVLGAGGQAADGAPHHAALRIDAKLRLLLAEAVGQPAVVLGVGVVQVGGGDGDHLRPRHHLAGQHGRVVLPGEDRAVVVDVLHLYLHDGRGGEPDPAELGGGDGEAVEEVALRAVTLQGDKH